jgi:hypothetical protein
MLNRHARRLIILFVLVAALAPLSSSSTTPNQQVTSTSRSCYTGVDAYGNCIEICCYPPYGCVQNFCSGRK